MEDDLERSLFIGLLVSEEFRNNALACQETPSVYAAEEAFLRDVQETCVQGLKDKELSYLAHAHGMCELRLQWLASKGKK